MRLFAGDARWSFATIRHGGHPATKADVHPGGEGMGPILGDHINVSYGFDNGVLSTFGTKVRNGAGGRFGLTLCGSKALVQLTTGSLPDAFFLDDPSWFPGKSRAAWQPITSAGVGKPETIKDGALEQGNVWIVRDLMEAIEKDRQPLGSAYDGRAALEMILAVYESHRLHGRVDLPLKNRAHPLTLL